MAKELEGGLGGQGLRIALVAARFNEFVTTRLLKGAQEALSGHGVRDEDVLVVWVPGAFELPLLAQRLAKSSRFDAVVCLGAVIKGETAHFDHISRLAAEGIAAASRSTDVPVLFGVLTTYTLEQALERSGGKKGNTGFNAAAAAIQMANLLKSLGKTP